MDGCRVLLFGAGKMAELTASHLLSQGAPKLFVANHHLERAEALAMRFLGQAVPWTQVYELMGDMDIIITSTGAPHYVISPREMAKAMERRRSERQLVLIDIAVPRDVDPAVGDLPAAGPQVVEIAVSADAKPGVYRIGDVNLRVVDRVLPPAFHPLLYALLMDLLLPVIPVP